MPTLSFIGCGKLGSSLGHLFQQYDVFRIRQVLTRSMASAETAVHFMGGGTAIEDAGALQSADVFLLAVPDSELPAAAHMLARADVLDERTTVLHCSGALSSTLLQECADLHAHIASAHPLFSFADPKQAVQNFACSCALEGDPAAVSMLSLAFARIGATPIAIPSDGKLRYHTAAVIASNYLVTLTEAALQAAVAAGLTREQGHSLLLPLMRQTLGNLETMMPATALTGPVARADWALVTAQQESLTAFDAALGGLYAELANATARLAGHGEPFGKQ